MLIFLVEFKDMLVTLLMLMMLGKLQDVDLKDANKEYSHYQIKQFNNGVKYRI